MSKITITAFRWVPPFAQGLVKDLRVRWALEEAGLAYEENLIGLDDRETASYRKTQPFGQVPVYREGKLKLFESGAIVLHIANKSSVLTPADETARARVSTWVFAALNSIEPAVGMLAEIDLFHAGEQWAQLRRPGAVEALKSRLEQLSQYLEGRDYLEGEFSAGDLMMTTVLRDTRQTDVLEHFPRLQQYCDRCTARPAFQRALQAQLACFKKNTPEAA